MCLEVEITEIGSTFHLMQAEVIMPCQLDTKLLNEKQLMCSYHYHFRLLYHFSQFYLKFLKVGYVFFMSWNLVNVEIKIIRKNTVILNWDGSATPVVTGKQSCYQSKQHQLFIVQWLRI